MKDHMSTMRAKLTLELEGGAVHESPGSALLVFLDETGGETLSDASYPIFGIGGAVARCDAYTTTIAPSWHMMKEDILGDANAAFHATDLTRAERERVGQWFRGIGARHIGLAGVALSPTEPIPELATNEGMRLRRDEANFALVYEALTRCLWDVWGSMQFSQIDFLIEDSERGRRFIKQFILPWEAGSADNGEFVPVKLTHYLVPKSKRAPGLEIADYVARALGRQALRGPRIIDPDFDATFRGVFSQNASMKVIEAVRAT